jgi:multidrug resistance efflux pump
MSTAFSRSVRSLEADGFRRSIFGFLLVFVLLGAWTAWFFFARVARYEVTDQARLEVDTAAHPMQATVSGRVISSRLALGAEVHTGDILVELDSTPQRLELMELRARLAAIPPQIQSLRDEVAAEQQARGAEQHATVTARDQVQAQIRESEATAKFAEDDSKRLSEMNAEGLLSERDLRRSKAEAQSRRAAVESLQVLPTRLNLEQQTRDSEREVRVRRIQEQITRLEGERETTAATIERLRYEVEQRRMRASINGRLGEVEVLRIGGVVKEGDKLAVVVPSGAIKVIADFLPSAALGRIRPGQPARMRLQGFPWAQYGTISATVSSVGSEVRDGRVRVELLVNNSGSRIPIQHGLPGSVEVQVENTSPANLTLRAAGSLVAAPTQ